MLASVVSGGVRLSGTERCSDATMSSELNSSRTRLPSNGTLMGGGMVDGVQSFSSDARKVMLTSVPEVALLS